MSQSTISSLDSGSFDRNRSDENNQQPTTLEVANTETVMAGNEDIDTTPPHDISNVFAAADLLSRSSSDSTKYKRGWINEKVIRFSLLSTGECPDVFSIALSIVLNHKEIASILAVTGTIFPNKYANAITLHKQKKQLFHATSVGNKRK